MAGRKLSKAVAVATAVALLAMLLAAGEAWECNVDEGRVISQCSAYCRFGGWGRPSRGCCDALRHADFGCICRKYGDQLRGYSCAMAIPSRCQIPGAPRSC
ncbi:hypothetical protein U9M48_016759 [Paspalum notatum var. saurae]|uniref:Bifunctional inhibitor/plant lipid transfer protein/seed storage helical domain-containing protein n=1 Tax=Paspalum notatum var. saurae TaxID=547442 RepID=A0AAQ3WNL6_PASNO